jgi:phosphate transport system permease protein
MIETTPQKPWASTTRDKLRDVAIFFLSAALSYAVVAITPTKGKLAYIGLFFIFYSVATGLVGWLKFGRRAAADAMVKTVIGLMAFITIMPIASILATVIAKGYKGINFNLFKTDMSLNAPTDALNVGGLLHAITGTFILVGIALILSVPLGILAALYVTEIKGRFTRPIKFLVQAMSGVPSIVAGLFILSAVLYPITKAYSGFMGSLALTILMIPTIARTSEEVLKLIPNDLREAGVALGGTQWRTVAMIVLPAARSGLMTAMILGVARIAGETAPLLLLTVVAIRSIQTHSTTQWALCLITSGSHLTQALQRRLHALGLAYLYFS